MSAPTDLVARVRSRLASSCLKITSADATHREFVGPNPPCPLFRTVGAVGAFLVPYGAR
jgi:hypothetical protein